jgi:hypothetical protein
VLSEDTVDLVELRNRVGSTELVPTTVFSPVHTVPRPHTKFPSDAVFFQWEFGSLTHVNRGRHDLPVDRVNLTTDNDPKLPYVFDPLRAFQRSIRRTAEGCTAPQTSLFNSTPSS